MRLARSKNAKRNSIWGFISNFITILLPFLVRTILIEELGAQYLGLSSLFTSILTVLNITELGFGTAIVYMMYKPLAEDDTDLLCALLNYYKKIYRMIGIVILTAGLVIIPFLDRLIKGTVPEDINIYILYVMYLLNTSLSYWLFAYKASILTIYQRNDIKSKIGIFTSSMLYIGQAVVVILTHSYYAYVAVLLCITVLNNIVPAIYVKKYYPQYICKGDISADLRKDIRTRLTGLMITKISAVSRNAFDSIIVSAFLGLVMVGIYNNYFYIINSVSAMMLVLTNAIAAGIGNSIAYDSTEKNLQDMRIINFWYMWISAWFMSCLVGLFQPFMRLWVGERLMFSDSIMMAFALYFFVQKIGDIQAQYFDAAGLWWYRKWYSVSEVIANIILNLVLGYFFGVFGIVIATILTIVFINFLGASSIIFKHYFKKGFCRYIADQLKWLTTATVVSVIIYFITVSFRFGNGLFDLITKGLICTVIPNCIILLFYFRSKLFKTAYSWLVARLRK